MPSTTFLAPLTNSRLVRRAADAVLLRYAHHRTVSLDRMDVGRGAARHADAPRAQSEAHAVRPRPRLRPHPLGRRLPGARAGPRVRVVLEHLLEGRLPAARQHHLAGEDSVLRAVVAARRAARRSTSRCRGRWWRRTRRPAFTTIALFRHANPAAKLFTGKFFFLGGSTDLRKQADGSLAGDLSGIAAKELFEFLRPYTFPPRRPHAHHGLGREGAPLRGAERPRTDHRAQRHPGVDVRAVRRA